MKEVSEQIAYHLKILYLTQQNKEELSKQEKIQAREKETEQTVILNTRDNKQLNKNQVYQSVTMTTNEG